MVIKLGRLKVYALLMVSLIKIIRNDKSNHAVLLIMAQSSINNYLINKLDIKMTRKIACIY